VECSGLYGCAFQPTSWLYFQIADKFSCWYNFKYFKLEIRGKKWFSVIISYFCYVYLLFYGFKVVLAERALFCTYKKCKANCEVLQIHQTKHFGFWIFHFCEPITVCVCVCVCVCEWERERERRSYCFINHERYWYIYLSRIFCQNLQEWPNYVIAQSELFVLVVHCHSDVTYQKWSFVVSEIFKLVSSLLLLWNMFIVTLFFFLCVWLVAIVITLISLSEGVLECICVCICIYIYIYSFICSY